MALESLSLHPALVDLLGANSNSSPEVLLALFVDPSSLGEKSNNQVTVQTFAKSCQRVGSIPSTPKDPRRTVGRLFCHLAIGDIASSIFGRRALVIGARIGKAYNAVQPVIRKPASLFFYVSGSALDPFSYYRTNSQTICTYPPPFVHFVDLCLQS